MIKQIQLFESRKIRTAWDEDREIWLFSIADVVAALTDSVDPKQYIKKMRSRDPELNASWGTICTLTEMTAADGKNYPTQAATMEGIFRVIQAIPSPKAEPFKQWMARVASDRIDQMIDPELSIDQAMADYKRLGYSDNWINQRLKSIEIRKDLTDEWKKKGLEEGQQFAILTDIIYKAWSDMTAKDYKKFKGLTKENLRDNMTNKELVLNMLAELSTKEISESRNPSTFAEHAEVAAEGGGVARTAREELEEKTGKSVVTSQNAKDLMNPKQPELPIGE